MAVIINEFEIIIEPPANPADDVESPDGPLPQAAPRVLRPYELTMLLTQQLERQWRVSAD